ncbi:bifunctional 23S rRNA (guanine(2069)-N(7))-methyltransferase RlmK/23S rRNA (guanine(2445)-N(2))-methyltransferase RlmL [Collinsella intestinalis]|uniref:Bifunctional 23S rRNA (Guanine(2069)-N(7))-methyltransferase RlmK/23S rRNA (Guanine(2445)-N(2))-methyltransferase RlmL n=2 Tax=Collinsella intestinalis TaxID=147207 RepID=A0A414NHE7_9ACTN|nr:bifunctional 23S rRNA (guanine(2069)-N(7))-methyltransferase RlmK/23S rRNA (guanine(2445)-N(2))-methyltransferase RlmL [Collinsella intestinalis]
MGLRQVRPLKGRVAFVGSPADAERACLWSRLASRIFVVLGRFACTDAEDLYEATRSIAWERILRAGATIAVTARGTNDELRNSHFAALRVKDALCDRMLEVEGRRPNVDTDDPDARISLTLRGNRASIQLDLSGDPLFKRLPREATRTHAAHVLRPDYAALTCAQGNWQEICSAALTNTKDAMRDGDTAASADGSVPANGSALAGSTVERPTPTLPVLIDACCAGGGVVLEAASILADRAPGLERRNWGFQSWSEHDAATWRELINEADRRAELAKGRVARIVATDPSGDAVACARRILKAAGLADRVIFAQPDLDKISRKLMMPACCGGEPRGFVFLDTTETAISKMSRVLDLATSLHAGACGADPVRAMLSIMPTVALTRDDLLIRTLGEPARSLRVMPNNEEAELAVFSAANGAITAGEGNVAAEDSAPAEDAVESDVAPSPATTLIDLGDGKPCPVLIPESEQFARRLRKVAKLRRKWAQREGVTCYRVYDADLPDYSAAIDLYEGSAATPGRWLVIAEYAAPREVDPALAEARLLDILTLAPRILQVDPDNVFAKARIRSRGGSQYGKQAGGSNPGKGGKPRGGRGGSASNRPGQGAGSGTPSDIRTHRLPLIEEGGLTFAVNFNDYLDTGIFLDHRITRGLVREHARGKRFFLNLFAYTGTATCYAADAGVEETVTVDLSNTYLDWAERNMEQNGFVGPDHHYVRADVMSWIRDMRQTRNRWDLIFCDPPTFSNSSKMGHRTWDVQRDHVELLVGLSRLLSREGEAIFSCNLRTFRPDIEELARAGVVLTDITDETIPEDFARNKKIHHCYLVKRYTSEEAMRRIGMSEDAIRERTRELREVSARKPADTKRFRR